MITLQDNEGRDFYLNRETCRDHIFRATRAFMASALRARKQNKFALARVFIRRLPSASQEYIDSTYVNISVSEDSLRVGCHTFEGLAVKRITQWALARKKRKAKK